MTTKLLVKIKNQRTGYDARLIARLVRACAKHRSVRTPVLVLLTVGRFGYDGYMRPDGTALGIALTLPKRSYHLRVLIWCIERAFLHAQQVGRSAMTARQRTLDRSGLAVPKWVPKDIRLPLLVADLQEEPRARNRAKP